jgi:lysylphosphatidylglycerol synthetase-like protein (DUF2156 family)
MFSFTKFYLVYTKPDSDDVAESTIFIKDGFSLWAALLGCIWLAYHRIWRVALPLFLLTVILQILTADAIIAERLAYAIELGLLLFVGFSASEWYARALEDKGYVLSDIVTGRDDTEAQQRFFERYTKAHAYPSPLMPVMP